MTSSQLKEIILGSSALMKYDFERSQRHSDCLEGREIKKKKALFTILAKIIK